MNRKETESIRIKISGHIDSRNIKLALDELDKLVRQSGNNDHYYELETLSENYRSLLQYVAGGYHDPMRDQILAGLCASILALSDEVCAMLISRESPFRRYQQQALMSEFGPDPAMTVQRITLLLFGREVEKVVGETLGTDYLSETSPRHYPAYLEQIFRAVWLTRKMAVEMQELLQRINQSGSVEWFDKCLVVSALTLSNIYYFDPRKMNLLIEFSEAREQQVWQRALTGLVISMMWHDNRLAFFPELKERLKKFSSDETLLAEVEFIILQLQQAQETEKITHEFEQEILPEMKKMMPRIEDKLHLDDPGNDPEHDEKNPGWKEMIEEVPGLFEKIEKFSRMQMEGGDVFMSTFQQLKRFDFFNSLSNWFAPFYLSHPALSEGNFQGELINTRLLESLEKAFYICNSDKYSFALNFRAIPEQQRSMIVTNFEAEFAQMQEMISEEQKLDQSVTTNAVFIQYIQDMYRFFRLFQSRQEFHDPFLLKVRPMRYSFYRENFARKGFIEKTASLFFEKERFPEAIESYADLMTMEGPSGAVFEKTGYCYQRMGMYRKAIEAYGKAELFDGDHVWLLKKLGICHLKVNEPAKALGHFNAALRLIPDDIPLQIQVGQCHLALKDYDQALQIFTRTSFYAPDNLKVLRPMAYCQFVCGKKDQAAESYSRILSMVSKPSAYDLMNAAHVQLCMNNRQEAFRLYKLSFQQGTSPVTDMIAAFDEDIKFLAGNGLPPEEIPLIRDYLLFQSST